MKSIERFAALLECKTEEAWQKSIFKLSHDYGFEQTLIAVAPDGPTSLGEAFLRSNYSSLWRSWYDDNMLVKIDPTVAHCVARATPLIWDPSIFSNIKQKEMYEEAASFGLRSGITLPYHGANGELGILCFVNDVKPSKRFHQDAMYKMPALLMIREFAFEASLRFIKSADQEPRPRLTPCELECLKWCAAGKSTWDIAQILSCSEGAVNFHIGNLRKKFKVSSRSQVVAAAIHCKILC
jgi:LuxR family quorum-sensing transcriptional regulator LasR